MSDVMQLINSKEIATRYIESCVTEEQCKVMESYLELYRTKVVDMLSHHQLVFLLDQKKNELFIDTLTLKTN